jgi:hypothetical protein
MEVIKSTVITKIQDELRNLERKKEKVPAEEKRFVEEVMEWLQRDLDTLRNAPSMDDFLDEQEKMCAQARLIEVLNELDLQLHDLETGIKYRFFPERATEIVEQFFITCQTGENVIKHSGLKEYITAEQINDLNQDMKKRVDRMIALSRDSDLLYQALQQSRRAQTVLAFLG